MYNFDQVVVTRLDGSQIDVTLNTVQLREKVVITDYGNDELYILNDSGVWREMTDQEIAQERRAWEADMKDMQQIKDEWREYRDS